MLDRRRFMAACTGMGLGSTLFPGVLWAQAQAHAAPKITREMIDAAASIADVSIADEYKQMMIDDLNDHAKNYEAIYALHMPNSVEPALLFDPVVPGMKYETRKKAMRMSVAPGALSSAAPKDLERLAFASVRELAELVRTKRVTSAALTEMYLERLKRLDATLKFTVEQLEDSEREQANTAAREIAAE